MEGKRAYWRRLDNAAKIFPATSTRKDTRVFRFYCELKEDVDGAALQKALDWTTEKYPVFLSVMRKGQFWYYLEKSDLRPMVTEEKEPPCATLYIRDRKSLLFRVNYYKNRINLEIYHALTDGTGAIQFLKELVKNYLIDRYPEEELPDIPLAPEDITVQDMEDDSFSKYYVKPRKGLKKPRGRKPCQIKGTRAGYGSLHITEGIVSSDALRKKAKEYDVSVTVFLTAVLLCAIHEEMNQSPKNRNVVLMVPVNLRKFFSSSSLLNFFGWIEPGYCFQDETYDFQDILQTVKKYFHNELTREKVLEHMGLYMALERNPILRLVPLVIKNPVMQAANRIAEKDVTAILSNIGVISMPSVYEHHILRFGVFISTPKVQLTLCSFQDDLVLSFSSAFQEENIERNFFRILKSFGIDSQIMEERFPEPEEPKYQGLAFFKGFTFAAISAAVIAVMVNIIFTPGLYWSAFVSGGALSMWTALAIGFFKRHNLLKNGIWQLIILSSASVLWDWFTGWHGWSVDYVLPILCVTILISLRIIVIVQKIPIQESIIYYILAGILGLVPFILLMAGLVHVPIPSVICSGGSFLFLTGLALFKGKDIKMEFRKKMHF